MPDNETEPYYCSTYCEHNADGKCKCQPCEWLRENAGLIHEPACALAPREL